MGVGGFEGEFFIKEVGVGKAHGIAKHIGDLWQHTKPSKRKDHHPAHKGIDPTDNGVFHRACL